ncbi:MAG: LptA/OstA family protein [Opitutales bacterium]
MPALRILTVLSFLLAGGLTARDASTVITSERLEMTTNASRNAFVFEGDVRVEATNMTATCDRLEVLANRRPGSDPDAAIGQIGRIESIIATGHVVISQAGRTARAGRAEIFPQEGKVILTEAPRLVDERGVTATGQRMILEQGKKRALIEGGGRVILPEMPDLGFDAEEQREDPLAEGVDAPVAAESAAPAETEAGETDGPPTEEKESKPGSGEEP